MDRLWDYPESISHASMIESARREAGITEKTIRLSVGIENGADLINDIKQALG